MYMPIYCSILLILSVNGDDMSSFIDDYYNGMEDYDMDYMYGQHAWTLHMDRMMTLMTRRGN